MNLAFRFDPDGVAVAAGRIVDTLDDELEEAVRRSQAAVVTAAKADHPYTDRTTTLTRSIRAYAPTGKASAGTLRGELGAYADYASYLERRAEYAFLLPALERSQGHFDAYTNDALELTVQRVGLGR